MMKVKEELVTPEVARQYLEKNTANRKIQTKAVSRYAEDMQKGNWKSTGDTIKFGRNGELIDGQHRLRAIVSANKAVRLLVARGVDDGAKLVTDTGMGRNFKNVLEFSGFTKNSGLVAAVCKAAYTFHYGRAGDNGVRKSNLELSVFLEENPEIHDCAMFAKGFTPRVGRIAPDSIIGAVRFASIKIDEGLSNEFFECLELPPSTQHPVNALKVALTRNAALGHRKARSNYVWALTIKAWNAFYQRRELSLLRYSIGEKFPLMEGYKYAEDTTTNQETQ